MIILDVLLLEVLLMVYNTATEGNHVGGASY